MPPKVNKRRGFQNFVCSARQLNVIVNLLRTRLKLPRLNLAPKNNEVSFEDYFLNKSTSAKIGSSEWWEIRFTSVKSRSVLNRLQSFVCSCFYFVFLN